jgi:serine/threonine protein kinase
MAGVEEVIAQHPEAAALIRHRLRLLGDLGMLRVAGVSLDRVLERLRDKAPASLTGADVCAALRAAGGGDDVPAPAEQSWTQLVCRWLQQLADAVDYAHRHGVVHRDIKPSNVMLTWSLQPMLLDFGLARSTDTSAITRTGVQPGSLPYMAPEQVRGDAAQIGVRTDVYALGVLFYELLTLQNPFRGTHSSEEETRQRIVAADAPPARVRNAAVSWDIETVCRCAMAPEPAQRYASAADLGRDLANLLALRPISARRARASLRLRRYVQRHPARFSEVRSLVLEAPGERQ